MFQSEGENGTFKIKRNRGENKKATNPTVWEPGGGASAVGTGTQLTVLGVRCVQNPLRWKTGQEGRCGAGKGITVLLGL